jgi:anti-sigma regulatory factor (Ser/Thr protein kinase)
MTLDEAGEGPYGRGVDGTIPVLAANLPASSGSVSRARRQLVDFAERNGAHRTVLGPIAVAISEAVTNVVVHAYPDGVDGAVRMTADIEDGALEVLVTDAGRGMRSGADAGGLGLGLGLKVIADLADRFSITAVEPHGTAVWMRFELAG